MKDVCDECPYDHCNSENCVDRHKTVLEELSGRIEKLERQLNPELCVSCGEAVE